jgi:hypothetical protein
MSIDRCCGDHGEQMLAPVRALGSSYVAAPHAARKPGSDPRIYRIYGAVDGTQLTYDPPGVGPATVNLGQMIEIRTETPFVVESQGPDNPFAMFTYMSGAGDQGQGGWGDPDFVRLVPPAQYLSHYVFFTDPTYPFTALTVVRKKKDGAFAPVALDCLGPVTGWQPVGASGEFELAHVKLVDHWTGQNGCNTGVRVMDSTAPFGVWVWGWGSEDTQTGWVSYGYPRRRERAADQRHHRRLSCWGAQRQKSSTSSSSASKVVGPDLDRDAAQRVAVDERAGAPRRPVRRPVCQHRDRVRADRVVTGAHPARHRVEPGGAGGGVDAGQHVGGIGRVVVARQHAVAVVEAGLAQRAAQVEGPQGHRRERAIVVEPGDHAAALTQQPPAAAPGARRGSPTPARS